MKKKKIPAGIAYYWSAPDKVKQEGFEPKSASLGTDLSQTELNQKAKHFNDLVEQFKEGGRAAILPVVSSMGTMRWLVDTYMRSAVFKSRVSVNQHHEYAYAYDRICETVIDVHGWGPLRFGDIAVRDVDIHVLQAVIDQYADRPRTAVAFKNYLRGCIGRMSAHYPDFIPPRDKDFWSGLVLPKYRPKQKGYVDRAEVMHFCKRALDEGYGNYAAAAVLCFFFHVRPIRLCADADREMGDVLWEHIDDDQVLIWQEKSGNMVPHPLKVMDEESGIEVPVYQDAMDVLGQVPRIGKMVVYKFNRHGHPIPEAFTKGGLTKAIRKFADCIGMPDFTLDKCRHGGMQEQSDAGVSLQDSMTLTGHRTIVARARYFKQSDGIRERVALARAKAFKG